MTITDTKHLKPTLEQAQAIMADISKLWNTMQELQLKLSEVKPLGMAQRKLFHLRNRLQEFELWLRFGRGRVPASDAWAHAYDVINAQTGSSVS